MVWKSLLPHKVTSVECYYFYYTRAYLRNGRYTNACWSALLLLARNKIRFSRVEVGIFLKFQSNVVLVIILEQLVCVATCLVSRRNALF